VCEDGELAIAVNELDREVEGQESRERLTRHRPRNDVASKDDLVHIFTTDLVQHRFKRRKVAVDVVECCNPHDSRPLCGHCSTKHKKAISVGTGAVMTAVLWVAVWAMGLSERASTIAWRPWAADPGRSVRAIS
jgi:hypothetical protein